jgi:hypothetical protein
VNIAGTQLNERSIDVSTKEHLPLNLIVGELFTGDDDGEEDEQTDGIFVIQSIGEVVITSNTEMSDGR